jgi:restriction system protein
MIRAGEGGYLIGEFSNKNLVAIGWHKMGDLTNVKSQDALKKLYRQSYPQEKPGAIAGGAAVIQKFCNVVQKTDPVITYDPNTREYLVGEITSDYYYKPGLIPDYSNIRNVEWKNRVSRDELQSATRNSLGSTLTLFAVSPRLGKISSQ